MINFRFIWLRRLRLKRFHQVDDLANSFLLCLVSICVLHSINSAWIIHEDFQVTIKQHSGTHGIHFWNNRSLSRHGRPGWQLRICHSSQITSGTELIIHLFNPLEFLIEVHFPQIFFTKLRLSLIPYLIINRGIPKRIISHLAVNTAVSNGNLRDHLGNWKKNSTYILNTSQDFIVSGQW